jgi:hypothetical protein
VLGERFDADQTLFAGGSHAYQEGRLNAPCRGF